MTKKDLLVFFKPSGEKRKCMHCGKKKEQGNGNVFYCNACRPQRRLKTKIIS